MIDIDIHHNTIPNCSKSMLILRSIVNACRTCFMRQIKYRWIKSKGFLRIPFNTTIWAPHKDVKFGHHIQFGNNCRIQCDLELGNYVLIASNVSFIGKDDHLINKIGAPIWNSGRGDAFKTIVEDDVWIGHGVIIIAGVTIGRGSVIAAGAVVNKSMPPYSIIGGVPARVLKRRFTIEQVLEHERLLYPEHERFTREQLGKSEKSDKNTPFCNLE